ncbi:putative aarF domain-containing protein kinase [Monoraphidium neglectum]|uniref:Putative aarF domain-containing protein kinase n=1 Tax=Monoraphidium neglectum TaxID=145388 RepID=A0A0D2M7X7_9CHLO|nr:putative aarF domain-containing protein kinase [Monoraphidium neglectum]KIY97206.1 putative aarF domain-containing protein kinase [Monoraphidium neglectum]|eukprot:XP_013896226.1 putative aarF domain-containing protein kinase [Monoraphidium neglectum]
MSKIVPALTDVFQKALSGGVSNLSFSTLSGDLGRTMYRFSFRIPPYYTLLVRSLSVLEGIALASDPNYKVLGAAYPWISRRLLTRPSPELRATLKRLLYKGGGFRFDRLEQLLQQAARARTSPSRPPPRSGGGGGAEGQAEGKGSGGPLALLLSRDGSYVREILEDEVAKGVDAAWRLAGDALVSSASTRFAAFAAAGPAALLLPGGLAERGGGGGGGGRNGNGGGAAPALVQVIRGAERDLLLLPRLSEESDAEQIRGLTRLATTMAEISSSATAASSTTPAAAAAAAAAANSTAAAVSALGIDDAATPGLAGGAAAGPGGPAAALVAAAGEAVGVLTWLVTELQRLPPDAQREAIVLPVAIMQKAGSRATARAIKWALSGAAPWPFNALAGGRGAAALPWLFGGPAEDRGLGAGGGAGGDGTSVAVTPPPPLAGLAPSPARTPLSAGGKGGEPITFRVLEDTRPAAQRGTGGDGGGSTSSSERGSGGGGSGDGPATGSSGRTEAPATGASARPSGSFPSNGNGRNGRSGSMRTLQAPPQSAAGPRAPAKAEAAAGASTAAPLPAAPAGAAAPRPTPLVPLEPPVEVVIADVILVENDVSRTGRDVSTADADVIVADGGSGSSSAGPRHAAPGAGQARGAGGGAARVAEGWAGGAAVNRSSSGDGGSAADNGALVGARRNSSVQQ